MIIKFDNSLVKEVGVNGAILLFTLYKLQSQKGRACGEWFKCTREEIKDISMESFDIQNSASKKLLEKNYIEKRRCDGMSSVKSYRILLDKIKMQYLFAE